MLHIRNKLMLKKEQKLKLKIIFLQFKKKIRINNNIATTTLYNNFINKFF